MSLTTTDLPSLVVVICDSIDVMSIAEDVPSHENEMSENEATPQVKVVPCAAATGIFQSTIEKVALPLRTSPTAAVTL